MKCNKCNIELMITDVKNKIIEGKPYTVQVMACSNPNCNDYKRELGELRHDFLEPDNPVIKVVY